MLRRARTSFRLKPRLSQCTFKSSRLRLDRVASPSPLCAAYQRHSGPRTFAHLCFGLARMGHSRSEDSEDEVVLTLFPLCGEPPSEDARECRTVFSHQ